MGAMIILMAGVRYFQYELFYDPFLDYFKAPVDSRIFPEPNMIRMHLSLLGRFALNTFLSLGVIMIIFRRATYLRFSVFFYAILLTVLFGVWQYMLICEFCHGDMAAFYVRRFLIQPLPMLLLIPAFYYQELQNKTALS